MNHYFIRYPGFRKKALTLSYDDGVAQDIRLIEIMNRHGIKGTFNLNSYFYTEHPSAQGRRRLTRDEALALYPAAGQEVAVHGYAHPFLEHLPAGNAAWEIVRDREILEEMFGHIVRGMAYPMGTYSDDVVATLRQCGIAYARTTKVSHGFKLPEDWLRLQATCHHKDPALRELCRQFLSMDVPWVPKLFYVWGHSYEFDEQDNWQIIEEFCETMGGHEDIWYATNGEIYDYLEAAGRIRSSVNGCLIENPTATTLYLETAGGENRTLLPGGTLELPAI